MEERSWRWGSAPPTERAYFSGRRKPGVVFRVPARRGGCGEEEWRRERREDVLLVKGRRISWGRWRWGGKDEAMSIVERCGTENMLGEGDDSWKGCG